MNKNFKNNVSSYRHYLTVSNVLFFILLLCGEAYAGSLTLAWDPSASSDVGGYTIYYGTTTKTYTANVDAGNVTTYQVSGLTDGQKYFFAVKAYNAAHSIESAFSNEISAIVPTSVALTADFTANTTNGNAPLVVSFTANTTGTVTGYSWNFGDTSIPVSTVQNPSVTYTKPGTYTVSLTVNGTGGPVTKSKTGYITVTAPPPPPPVADFSVNTVTGYAPLAVQFTDSSTGNITNRTWSFGDGTSSTELSPAHTYTNTGTYSVSLTVSGPDGNNTKTSASLITVLSPFVTDTKGLVAAYNFEELNRSIIADASGLGNHGLLKEGVRVDVGRYGKALEFDGINDWITIPDSPSLDLSDRFTLEAWVKPLSTGPQSVLFKEQAKGSVYCLYASESGNVPMSALNDGNADSIVAGTSALPVNEWSYLTSTYDGAVQRLYLNGVKVAEKAQTGLVKDSRSPLRIGGNKIWGDYFHGFIDEVRIYNRALNQAEITSDFNTAVEISKPEVLVLGNGTVESVVDTNPQGIAQAFKTTPVKDGVVTSMRVYLGAGTTATEIVTGFYDDNSGHPGNLLSFVKANPDKSGLWVQIPVPTFKVTAGKPYWIAILGTNGDVNLKSRVGTGSVPLETSSQTSLGTLPSNWTTGSVYPNDGPVSMNGIGYTGQ